MDDRQVINSGDNEVISDFKLDKANKTYDNYNDAYNDFIELLGDKVIDVQELKSDKRFSMNAKYYTKDGYIANKRSKIINISKRGSTRILFATHGGKLVVQLIYYKPDTNRIIDYGSAYGYM